MVGHFILCLGLVYVSFFCFFLFFLKIVEADGFTLASVKFSKLILLLL